MRCPKCGSRDDKVIDSRQSRDSSSIRRRRQCLKCGYRFTTYEEIERSDLRVVKRDRTHEPFDRRKLVNSLAKACEKRSISLVTLESAVDEIVHELETSGREVSSQTIGQKSSKNCAVSMKSRISVTPRSIVASKMSINSSTPSTRWARRRSLTRSNVNYFHPIK